MPISIEFIPWACAGYALVVTGLVCSYAYDVLAQREYRYNRAQYQPGGTNEGETAYTAGDRVKS